MRMLVHRAAATTAPPFELAALKAHIRVDGTDDDVLIETMGRAAAAELEQFAQVALLTQTIRVTVFDPPSGQYGVRLPIGPVAEGHQPTVTIDGEPFTDFDFESGDSPYIRWLASFHALTPKRLAIEYQAGFGNSAQDIPADLAQALMDQAALHYDGRSPMDNRSLTTSPHMARIGARYRGVQL